MRIAHHANDVAALAVMVEDGICCYDPGEFQFDNPSFLPTTPSPLLVLPMKNMYYVHAPMQKT